MTGFTAEWLALREPADRAARSERLTELLAAACADKPHLRLIDLGAGNGANLRFLAPRLGRPQHWLLVDQDSALLEQAARQTSSLRQVTAEARTLDLASDLGRLDLAAADVVTASALMDLVSAQWFDRLADLCHAARALLLFALTYGGRVEFQPPDPFDARLIRLFNRHQRRDKGFGPALGPDAPAYIADRLRQCGFRVESAPSDWRLSESGVPLQEALLAGHAKAAQEVVPRQSAEIAGWLQRRRAILATGQARLTVGHADVLAAP